MSALLVNASGKVRETHWVSLSGSGRDGLTANFSGSGSSSSLLVYRQKPLIVDRPGVHIVQTASLISAAGSSGSASETFDASVDFTISLDGEGNALVTDGGSGAILMGESTGTSWGFTNINYNRNEDRDWQYNGEPVTGLNSSGQGESHGEMAVTYAAASRVVSRTNYGASAGNRGFAQDDMPSNMPPNGTVSAFVTSDVDGRGREFLEIRKSGNSDDYEEYDEWDGIRYVRDETGSFSHIERYTNDVVLHGDEAAVLLSDGSVMWRGSSSASLTSKIHYRQESEYDGSALEKDDPTRGQWAYDSNRKAEFDHTSTLTITILPVSDTLIISYAKSGDSQVSVTGHDEYDQPWEKSDLELAFDALAATTLDSILGTTPNSSPASDTSQPNSGTWLQTGDGSPGNNGSTANSRPSLTLEELRQAVENTKPLGLARSGPDCCIDACPHPPRLTDSDRAAVAYLQAFGESYVDYVNPWNGKPANVDYLDWWLSFGTKTAQVTGVVAGSAAAIVQGATVALAYAGVEFTTFAMWGIHAGRFHYVYQVGTQGLHATGFRLGSLSVVKLTEDQLIRFGLTRVTPMFRSTVINPGAASETGQHAWTCVTAGLRAYFKGNFKFW